MIRHTFIAMLAASTLAVPVFAQGPPPPPPPSRVPAPPRVIIQGQSQRDRELQRELARKERENRVEQSERVNHTFRIGSSGELQVSNLSGDITIARGGGNEVRVEAVKIARARTEEQAREMLPVVRVEFSERAGRAEVKAVYPREHFGHSNERNVSIAVAYTITAPEGTRINVRTLSGGIKVTGIKGELSLVSLSGAVRVFEGARVTTAKSTSGDVEIRDLQSDMPLEARSTSGNIIVSQSRAPRMELGTISGSVTIENVQTPQIDAQSLSGDVLAAFPFAKNGRYELNSHSGNVRVAVIGGTGFELDANTFSGSVQSALTIVDGAGGANAVSEASRGGRVRRVRGRVGDGSALLDVTTFSGNVILTKK